MSVLIEIRKLITLYGLVKRSRKLIELIVWAKRKGLVGPRDRYEYEQSVIAQVFAKLTWPHILFVEVVQLWLVALKQLTPVRPHYRRKRRR